MSAFTCTLVLSGESPDTFSLNLWWLLGHILFGKSSNVLALWLNINCYVCVCVCGGYLLNVFMYTEKKSHKFTETTLPLPLTSDERDCSLWKVESRILSNASNHLHSHLVSSQIQQMWECSYLFKSYVWRNHSHEKKYLHCFIKVPLLLKCFCFAFFLSFLKFLKMIFTHIPHTATKILQTKHFN